MYLTAQRDLAQIEEDVTPLPPSEPRHQQKRCGSPSRPSLPLWNYLYWLCRWCSLQNQAKFGKVEAPCLAIFSYFVTCCCSKHLLFLQYGGVCFDLQVIHLDAMLYRQNIIETEESDRTFPTQYDLLAVHRKRLNLFELDFDVPWRIKSYIAVPKQLRTWIHLCFLRNKYEAFFFSQKLKIVPLCPDTVELVSSKNTWKDWFRGYCTKILTFAKEGSVCSLTHFSSNSKGPVLLWTLNLLWTFNFQRCTGCGLCSLTQIFDLFMRHVNNFRALLFILVFYR